MCLVVFAWKTHPKYKLVLAANRDEFHRRPTQALGWWNDCPNVLAGRDLQAGGTWLAASRTGRIATVTNYREQVGAHTEIRSRGEIVTSFVGGGTEPDVFSQSIAGDQFAGFNLLAALDDKLCYVSNRGNTTTCLSPGIYGLSNASLDTPWTKLLRARDALEKNIAADRVDEQVLMQVMADRQTHTTAETALAPLASDRQTDVSAEIELDKALTAPFIVTPLYGTRCTTVLLLDYAGNITMSERRFDSLGTATGTSRFNFSIA